MLNKKQIKISILVPIIILFLGIILICNLISLNEQKKESESDSTEKIYCSLESHESEWCMEIYKPVCGWFDSEKIQCITFPCAQTFSNSCFSCMNEDVLYYTEGECPKPN